jgi:hypothetical protein
MPRRCAACHSPDRDAIDKAFAMGEAAATVARRFGIGVDAAERHAKNHVRPALRRAAVVSGAIPSPVAQAAKAPAGAVPVAAALSVAGLASEFSRLIDDARRLVDDAASEGVGLRATALATLAGCLDRATKVAGMLAPDAGSRLPAASITIVLPGPGEVAGAAATVDAVPAGQDAGEPTPVALGGTGLTIALPT